MATKNSLWIAWRNGRIVSINRNEKDMRGQCVGTLFPRVNFNLLWRCRGMDINSYEINNGEIEIHGVRIVSRYNEIDELKEMIAFCEIAERFHLSRYIKRIFYDSKVSVCAFECYVPMQIGDPIYQHYVGSGCNDYSVFIVWHDLLPSGGINEHLRRRPICFGGCVYGSSSRNNSIGSTRALSK